MRDILYQCRLYFLYTGILSFVINILLLTPILFLINALDRVTTSRSLETLVVLAIIALFALSMEAFLESVNGRLLSRFSLTLHRLLGKPALNRVLVEHGEENVHALEDVDLLQSFITTKAVKALFDLPWIPFYLLIIYFFHPLLVLIGLVAILIMTGLAFWEQHVTKNSQKQVGDFARVSKDFVATAYHNSEAVNALGMRESVIHRWWLINADFLDRKNRVEDRVINIQALTTFVRLSVRICGLSLGAYLVIHDGMSPGIMIAANILMSRALAPMSSVISAGKLFIDAKEAYKRLDVLLKKTPQNTQNLQLPAPKGQLTVERVFFFLNRDRNILNGVSFEIGAGECLAVIGASGSGKSTLSKLLVGHYRPVDGFLRLDGADIWFWAQNDLGAQIGYLPQEVLLFSGTVAENICRLQNVKEHEEEIVAVAKKTGIHEMVLSLSKGYDTEIGHNGNRLSGGQRQRIGLARALFGNPKFIVLDEPNSNLDGESEIFLSGLLKTLKEENVSVVVVTHKPTLMKNADKVLALHEGNVVKFGSRKDVLQHIQVV